MPKTNVNQKEYRRRHRQAFRDVRDEQRWMKDSNLRLLLHIIGRTEGQRYRRFVEFVVYGRYPELFSKPWLSISH